MVYYVEKNIHMKYFAKESYVNKLFKQSNDVYDIIYCV